MSKEIKKNKGFTLVEIIIALAIAAMIMAAMYSFFSQSTKTSVSSEVRSELQEEAEKIQAKVVKIGTQSKKVDSINVGGSSYTSSNIGYESFTATPPDTQPIDINSITFEYCVDESTTELYTFELNGNELKLKSSTTTEVLSKNVESFKIRPSDINSTTTPRNLDSANGIQFVIKLGKKKGYTDITCPVEAIIKFRNKNL